MAKPLAGIRVIELANFIAGPLAGTLLADMGADVVKVEPPQGDMARATPPIRNGESVSFVALNRNKRSLVLDLKRPEATEILLRLAAKSDVFLEAYRPGVLDKLGLGAEQVKAANAGIVYTSVSGFGQSGPYRKRAGVNLIIEAFSGVLSVTGEPELVERARPIRLQKHVRRRRQLVQDLDRLRPLEVEHQAALVAVERDEADALVVADRRRRARHVALRRLHLHHVGPHVGEQRAGERPGNEIGKLDHPNAGQRFRHR